jgi:hypothetical protein
MGTGLAGGGGIVTAVLISTAVFVLVVGYGIRLYVGYALTKYRTEIQENCDHEIALVGPDDLICRRCGKDFTR